jgi:NADPH2 dehydrogenase
VVAGVRAEAPGLAIGVRISAVDWIPFRAGPDGRGEPEPWANGAYRYAFGGDGSGVGADLTEPRAFLNLLESLDIRLVCVAVGSPYYNPHIQRPALFPPSDGYLPPEDPLIDVARQIAITAELKRYAPGLIVVGSGYSYLQEWLPHVGQAVVRNGAADFIGLWRMALSYPEMPADVLSSRPLRRKQICRTFSDCTTAPRNGMVSGCYPLDPFYKAREEAVRLAVLKR